MDNMKIDKINVQETIDQAQRLLKKEKNISVPLRAIFLVILTVMQVMLGRMSLNSKNSSKPPSSDPNRKKKVKSDPTKRKPGGQPGRVGKQLKLVPNPDTIETLSIDKRTLPKADYKHTGFEARQVIDYTVSLQITEYRAEVLEDSQGNRYVATFPTGVSRPVQYGNKLKTTSVYMSQFQLIPYKRIEDYFNDHFGIEISVGSLFNFNQEAYELLAKFEHVAKQKLIDSKQLHVDETGVNINGKRFWLHTACNDKWTHFYPHEKRGAEAMDVIGILPLFRGVLCHDHWKPYYTYQKCLHALCNAHHLRELEYAATVDNQKWAKKMIEFLRKLNDRVTEAGGKLSEVESTKYHKQYQILLGEAQTECPLTAAPKKQGQRGRGKKTKSQNLLARLINYEADVLRFMDDIDVTFTNNLGENDLRMTKVQQKISGCFRSIQGAFNFCRIRAYLITCRKHDMKPTEALETLFQGKLPSFVDTT
jgi:transposase